MPVWTEATLHKLAQTFLKKLNIKAAVLDVFLLKHDDIKSLKARFIKKQTEPNVLSFKHPVAFPHPEAGRGNYLGEVYLNKDILRESPERGAPLLLHGILHLLDYDHEKKSDAVKMEALEKKILDELAKPKKKSAAKKKAVIKRKSAVRKSGIKKKTGKKSKTA